MSSLTDIIDKKVIQGGMGVAISGNPLAREVSLQGQLGVVSATGVNFLLQRKLQQGDPTGEIRDALKQFPNQDMAERIFETFFVEGGIAPSKRYLLEPLPSFEKIGESEIRLKNRSLEDALVVGAFVEVYLAKKGHQNPVGANFLNKLEFAQLPTLYGAMLAGVDVALIGAGFPRQMHTTITELVSGNQSSMSIRVYNKLRQILPRQIVFDPERFNSTNLNRPVFVGIVGNHMGAKGLPHPDGYVFEGPIAGGHNAPARSKEFNDIGEPFYGPKDRMDFGKLATQLKLNEKNSGRHQSYWLAGGYADRLSEALSQGAAGVQVGTPFAYCRESGMTPELRQQALVAIMNGVEVYTNAKASSTGFPFKELPLEDTIGVEEVYEARRRVCDLGFLSDIFEDDEGNLIIRCPAEPVKSYVGKGGDPADTAGVKCLCNGLSATPGFGMPGEKPLVTSGADLTPVLELVKKHGMDYSAENVINHVLER